MQVLVTGAAGFVGRHLVRHLLDEGVAVAGIVHPGDDPGSPDALQGVRIFQADLLDADAVAAAISDSEPAVIYHLAAFSNPESSRGQSRHTLETNIMGTLNLLEAAQRLGSSPRVLLVGSCQQYGLVAEGEQPIREDQPQRPLSPYGVSKASQELLGLRFFLSERLPVLSVRSFNHTGPGQDASYVCSSFARQVAEIEIGRRAPRLRVGNLSPRRDFIDVRDVVRAYRGIVEAGKPGLPYNVCRGEALSVRDILDRLLGLTDARVEVEVDRELYHAVDVPLLLGDNTRLREDVGWKPNYTFEETLRDLLNDWRHRLSSP